MLQHLSTAFPPQKAESIQVDLEWKKAITLISTGARTQCSEAREVLTAHCYHGAPCGIVTAAQSLHHADGAYGSKTALGWNSLC